MRIPLVLLLVLSAFLLPATAQSDDVERTRLYMTDATGVVDGSGTIRLLQPSTTGQPAQATFAPALTQTGASVASMSWASNMPWAEEKQIVGDAEIQIQLSAGFNGAAQLTVRLSDVSPAGVSKSLGQATRTLSVGDVVGQVLVLELPTDGQTMLVGSHLRLDVELTGVSLATIMNYDGGSPSGISELLHKPLDTDGDGVGDTVEQLRGTDPLLRDDREDRFSDRDRDGRSDSDENATGTDPRDSDSDNDGWSDGAEHTAGTNPNDANSRPTDNDGNGLADEWQQRHGVNDPTADPDDDGLSNAEEQTRGTDPNNADSDGDGDSDGDEVRQGTDPNRPARQAALAEPRVLELFLGGLSFAAALALIQIGLLRRHAL